MKQASRELDSDILYVDSLTGIKKIFSERKKTRKEIALKKKVQWLEKWKIVQKEKLPDTKLSSMDAFHLYKKAIRTNKLESNNSNLQTNHENEMTPPRSNSKVVKAHTPKKVKKDPIREKVLFCNPKSFSLMNLHRHFLGFVPSQSHGAEADCLALLRTTAMLGQDWIDWVEMNCQRIQNCKEMWGKMNKLTEDSKEDFVKRNIPQH